MSYGLPKSVEINGKEFAIRYDYRVILDIFEAMNDPDSSEEDRALDVLQIFYIDFDELTDYDAAMKEVFRFINGGEEPREQRGPTLWTGRWTSPASSPRSIACWLWKPRCGLRHLKLTRAGTLVDYSLCLFGDWRLFIRTDRPNPRQEGQGQVARQV